MTFIGFITEPYLFWKVSENASYGIEGICWPALHKPKIYLQVNVLRIRFLFIPSAGFIKKHWNVAETGILNFKSNLDATVDFLQLMSN